MLDIAYANTIKFTNYMQINLQYKFQCSLEFSLDPTKHSDSRHRHRSLWGPVCPGIEDSEHTLPASVSQAFLFCDRPRSTPHHWFSTGGDFTPPPGDIWQCLETL